MFAKIIIEHQLRQLKKANFRTFIINNKEYQLRMSGSAFCPSFSLMVRDVGRRNYQYLTTISAVHCRNATEVVNKAMNYAKRGC